MRIVMVQSQTQMWRRKNGDLIEPRPCHEYTMPDAKKVDTKDKEPATELIRHNSSCLPTEESMQVPESEDRFTDPN